MSDDEKARGVYYMRAAAALEAIANILDAAGLEPEARVKLLLSAAAVEYRQDVGDGQELPSFEQLCRDVQEIAVLAEHPAATTTKGDA